MDREGLGGLEDSGAVGVAVDTAEEVGRHSEGAKGGVVALDIGSWGVTVWKMIPLLIFYLLAKDTLVPRKL